MNSGWNLPPGVSVADIEAAQDDAVFISWPVFAVEYPDQAAAIEAEWLASDEALDAFHELDAVAADTNAFLYQSHRFVKTARQWRKEAAERWLVSQNKRGPGRQS